ncbi:hypothetical protein [Streptomyces sp. NBC_01262]|uniref:hypothetical protein n=1 Tax=Streptomyces sp. NBC_01262 TaxID=2903803 RepID=UPI002E316839|nr:hypothetical protein [Streptomyces sp. NBC_01262]
MNETLRRTWPAVLTAVVASLYVWIGLTAHGWDRILGLAGGPVVLAALVAAHRSLPGAMALLAVGALPLAVTTWWSIATPVLAVLVLLLGWFAIRNLSRPRRDTASVTTSEPRP